MIDWIITTLFGSFMFALMGFTSITKGFASIARVLFYIFIAGFALVIIKSFI